MPKKRKKSKPLENVNHEKFCVCWASEREFFGNGVQSYIEAYNVDLTKNGAYESSRASASRLLSNVTILARIDELVELGGLNDVNVDKQLNILITQKAEMGVSIAAIREYNKLKKRTERDTVDQVVKIVLISPDKKDKGKGDEPF